jgi:hypothetical protein
MVMPVKYPSLLDSIKKRVMAGDILESLSSATVRSCVGFATLSHAAGWLRLHRTSALGQYKKRCGQVGLSTHTS